MRLQMNQGSESNSLNAEPTNSPSQQIQGYISLDDNRQDGGGRNGNQDRARIGILGWVFLGLAIALSILGSCLFFITGNVLVMAAFNAPLLAIISAYFQSRFRS